MATPIDVVSLGAGYARIMTLTVTNNTITGISSTPIDFNYVTSEEPMTGNYREKTTYNTKETSNAITVRVVKRTTTYDAVSGLAVAPGGVADSFKFTALVNQTLKTQIDAILRNTNQPVAVIFGEGRKSLDQTVYADGHLLGFFEGNVNYPHKNELAEVSITVSGYTDFVAGTGFTYTAYNAAVDTAITPLNDAAVTPKALTSAQFAGSGTTPGLINGVIIDN